HVVEPRSMAAGIRATALGDDLESPPCGKRNAFGQHAPQLEDFAGLDETSRAKDGLGLHVVARTALVCGTPLGGTALIVGRWSPRLRSGVTCEDEHCECEQRCRAHSISPVS